MLDIIIPAYNAKDTIFKTLSSIAVQRCSVPFNVIIVNDCSEYDYSSFVDYFSKYYPIKEIKTKKNIGPGGARNTGIDNSNSEFIVFIDSDDFFYSTDSIDKLYKLINKSNYDLVISNFIYERDNERTIKEQDHTWLHGKIYRRGFLDKNNIRFNNTMANEDNGFNRLILLLNPNIYYLNEITYVYSENNNSITRKNNREYKLDGLEGLIYNMKWAMDEATKRNCIPELIKYLTLNVLISMYFYYLELYNSYDVKKILKWSKPLLSNYQKYNVKSINKNELDKLIDNREKDYIKENKIINKFINFEEFIDMVCDYND